MDSKVKIMRVGVVDSVFGSDCVIFDHVNIYGATFGNNCFVGPWCEIQRNVKIGSNVRIQSRTLICEGMNIEDDVFVGHGVVTANSKYPVSGNSDWECLAPTIKEGASIGSNATILPGVTIGRYAVVGAGAVVSRNVEDHDVVVSNTKLVSLEKRSD